MDLPDNSSWCYSEEDEGKDVSSILLYYWLLMIAENIHRWFSIVIWIDDWWDAWWLIQYCYTIDWCWLLKSLIDVSVLLCWLLMTIEMIDGFYSITIMLVDRWLMQYWLKMLMIDVMLDNCLIWWLLSIIILLLLRCLIFFLINDWLIPYQ